MNKEIIATFTCIIMVLGLLAACGKAENGIEMSSDAPVTSGGVQETAPVKQQEAAPVSDKPDTWIADRTVRVQAYVDDIGYAVAADQLNTDVMKELERRTGMKIEFLYTPGEKDRYVMEAQLAAGGLPDMIVSYLNNSTRPEFPILYSAAKAGMFTDLAPYLKNTSVYSKYFREDYLPTDTKYNVMFRDDFEGACYFVHLDIDAEDKSLEWNSNTAYVGGLYIRRDIAEDLGLNTLSINSSEKLYELLKTIKDRHYTDTEGREIIPLGPKYWGGSFDALDYVMTDLEWGLSGDFNVMPDGSVLHEAQTEWLDRQVAFIRKLLAEGLMDSSYFTMEEDDTRALYDRLGAAVMSDCHNYEEIIYGSDTWVPLGPLADFTGSTADTTTGKGAYGQWAIPVTTERPEEIVKLMDYLSSYEGQLLCLYGVEGVTYNMVDGKPVFTDEVKKALAEGDKDKLLNWGAAFDGSGVYGLQYLLTDIQNENYFGENVPGAGEDTSLARAVEIAESRKRPIVYIPGLKISAYLSEVSYVNDAMSLLDYDGMRVKAFLAGSDEEAAEIVESFRESLKTAQIDDFLKHMEVKLSENPDTVFKLIE